MNDQVRATILSALAALVGWLAITSVGLLIQVSSLQSETRALGSAIKTNDERDARLEDKIYEELKILRQMLEDSNGRK
jgi:hypothetical protein